MLVNIKRLPHACGTLPTYETPGAVGLDLATTTTVKLYPDTVTLVATGIAVAVPEGMEAQIRPRSGFSTKNKVIIPNAPGTIDQDYRGEIKVALLNLGHTLLVLNRGTRIAQLVFAPVIKIRWNIKDTLTETARGQGGFGSTGLTYA